MGLSQKQEESAMEMTDPAHAQEGCDRNAADDGNESGRGGQGWSGAATVGGGVTPDT